jgi:TetR/AcrR family transcriptional regulator, cholesterol catabolism regulator
MASRAASAPGARPVARRNRDAEIFTAAIEVFSEKGYSAASLQDVADRVGLLKGSLYHYISAKESLLYRIFHQAHEEAVELMAEVAGLGLPPVRHLYEYLRRLTLWYLDNRARSALYFTEWRYLTGEYGETVRRERREFEGYVRDIIRAAIEAGDARPDLDAKLASFATLASINSVLVWFSPSGPYDPDRIAAEIAELSCASVCCPSRYSAGR